MVFRPKQGPSQDMQKRLHDAKIAAAGHAGMEEHDMTSGRHERSWVKMGGPLEVPDEGLRPELAPKNLGADENLDNVIELHSSHRVENPADAPETAVAK